MVLPQGLDPNSNVGLTLQARGLYDKETINRAKYKNFSRFGRIIDPYGRLNNTREYLFFTKPDLHIADPKSSTLKLNPQLSGNGYMNDLVRLYPDVVRELQSSVSLSDDPFSHLLSFGVNSNLDLPSIEASTIDTSATAFGTSMEYITNAENSDEQISFSLEFVDSKELEIYNFFKGFQEYHIARKSGTVTPPSQAYTDKKILHNVMGIYKFLVDEDMETLIHYSYIWGAFPVSAPRDSFSNSEFSDGLTFTVSFKAGFVSDLDPIILREFNMKTKNVCSRHSFIPIHEMITNTSGSKIGDPMGTVDGRLPVSAKIYESGSKHGHNGRSKYKIAWFG